ncbi:MAG: cytochrome P460 family protein [Desulfobulbaceae bacterium]|nr:cytochrome P460 family protein [Desulfobulbaceae bacterium]
MKNFKNARLSGIMVMTAALLLAPSIAPAESGNLPVEDAKDLQNYISRENPYTEWELWPGTEKMYKGTEPHGVLLTTYVNDIALDALREGKDVFPQGAIIAKENYTGDRKLTALTVMYKVEGYNPDGGDWYWLRYQADGTVDAEGKVRPCINCHRAKQDQDWVFTAKP